MSPWCPPSSFKKKQGPRIKTFRELSRMCLSYGEIAIGYRKNKKIILNPEKDIPIELLDSDSVIVFAEE